MAHHLSTHTCSHTQSAAATSARYKLSLIPFHGDPCQARVTFAGQGHHTIHTHSCLHLFICLLVSLWLLECAPTPSGYCPTFHTWTCGQVSLVCWITTSTLLQVCWAFFFFFKKRLTEPQEDVLFKIKLTWLDVAKLYKMILKMMRKWQYVEENFIKVICRGQNIIVFKYFELLLLVTAKHHVDGLLFLGLSPAGSQIWIIGHDSLLKAGHYMHLSTHAVIDHWLTGDRWWRIVTQVRC